MPRRYIHAIDNPPPLSAAELTNLLGGKGASLVVMKSRLGLPVPPAFIITTEAFREWRAKGSTDFLDAELRAAMHAMESALGRGFGAAEKPLVVSVRSGAPVSMPGMMDTLLDLGLNPETERALALELGAAIASDAHQRFVSMFRKIVGEEPPADPWLQLRAAISAVFRSWDSPRARVYRRKNGIAETLGTAVTVQAMVFGTAAGYSGTGVAFTRDPSTGEPKPTGDWLRDAQGDDVVAGTHATATLDTLAAEAPEVWRDLHAAFARLELHYQDFCDIEFTVQSGKLWILQARAGKRSARAAVRIAVDRALDPRFSISREQAVASISVTDFLEALHQGAAGTGATCVTTGVPASPGIVSGRVCFSADAAVDAEARGEDVILVRSETSPEDIHGMAAARGILTRLGGQVSHAAIVAREWGKAAVVGASELMLDEHSMRIGDRVIREGDEISLDGGTGKVFLGRVETTATRPDPYAQTLLDWAREIAGADHGDPAATLRAAQNHLKLDHGKTTNQTGERRHAREA